MPQIQLTHDGAFDIAIGRNRRELNWRNKEMKWSELVEKLSTTHRTAETYQEYANAKKQRQDEIKDIGGFVGGYLSNGRRKPGNVVHRQLVTLDIDYAKANNIWDTFTLFYGCAAAIYSTHKHAAESPRLRLIIPLDRPVMSDEWIAISRRIAGNLGIDNFDNTTFEIARLMYWPSTSKDGEYYFEHQDGEWLNADEILAGYHNWKDSSEWPISERYNNIIHAAIKKQGDPLEKPGIIGAFCRTYGIEEVIDTYLSDEYKACDVPGRYTYLHGSTSAGLVIYEDKYAYSHHGTDPTSGKLCNAFDLVRLHKFGLKDEDAKEGTPGNKLPSYTAMVDFAGKDTRVRIQLGVERLQDANVDFVNTNEEEAVAQTDETWMGELEMDRKGNYYSTINNIVLILENDPALKNTIAFDEFEQRAISRKNLPWRKVTHKTRYLTDRDDANLEHYLERTYQIASTKLEKALEVVYERKKFHPIREYLNGLTWDGESRIDTLLIEYMGAPDTAYTRAVTRKALVAAVARVFQPGVKFDYMLTFVGRQGLGKSSLIGKLGKEWYSDSFNTVQGKESFEQIQGVWIVEMPELAGLKKADVENVKHYVSKREDRYRVAYGRRVENFPRQCVFFGSTNRRDFLRDTTGNRRFWPVATSAKLVTKDVFKDLTEGEIDQIWSEALVFYKKGEALYLSRELEEEAFKVQTEHAEYDERTGLIQRYLDIKLPANWDEMDIYERRAYLSKDDELQPDGVIERTKVCIAEIWCEVLGGVQKDMNRYNTKEIHELMRTIEGWEDCTATKMRCGIYGLQRGYKKIMETVTKK